MPTRRQLIASAGTIVAGGTAFGFASQTSDAQFSSDINGLEIPDTQTSSPVKDVTLSVDASYSYKVAKAPSRVILRLKAKRPNGEYTQIAATEPATFPSETTDTLTLNGSLMALNGLESGSIRPEDTGASTSYDIQIKLTLQVYVDRELLGTADATTTATLTASRDELTLSATIGGDGEIDVITQSD